MLNADSKIYFSEEWFPVEDGRTFPDWMAIFERCGQIPSEKEKDVFMGQIVELWCSRLCGELGDDSFAVMKSRNFLIVAPTDKRRRKALAKCCEEFRKTTLKTLDSIGEGFLPVNVVMAFSDEDGYYDYLSAYYPEGDFAGSSGVFLSGNCYPHIAILTPELETYRTVLAHEMTHLAMNHLTLPAWLNEGITQMIEREIAPDWRFHSVDTFDMRDLEKRSRDFWNEETIQWFWSGEAFQRTDSQEVAYYFARVLFYLIHREIAGSSKQLAEFVTQTVPDDAGESAFQATFKASLQDLIEEVFGDGNWVPRPDSWEHEVFSD